MIYDIWYMIYSYVSYIYIYVWIIKLSSYIIISSYIPTIPHFLSSSLPNKNTRTTMKTYRWRHRKPARQPSHPIWRTCWKSCCALQRSPLLIPHLHTFAKWKITFGINLVGDFNPSEKYESQLGWWHSQYIWKKKVPNHQPLIIGINYIGYQCVSLDNHYVHRWFSSCNHHISSSNSSISMGNHDLFLIFHHLFNYGPWLP